MSKPKLALIPSGYKSGKVYSILPNDASGDFDFSRASVGTRVRKDGLIEEVADNVPRLDWLNSDCPSLKLEPQRTNLQIRSEEFDNSAWSKQNVTIVADEIVAPNGEYIADKLTSTTGSTNTYIYEQHTLSTSTDYSISVFVKKGTSNNVAVDVWDNIGDTQGRIEFNLDTETITSQTGTASFENYGNGWYRLKVTFTTDATLGTTYFRIRENGDINGAYFYLWGAMLEQGSYCSSYIKTEASTVTRLKDECLNGGDSDLFDITEGTFFVDAVNFGTPLNDYSMITLSDGSNIGNFVRFIYESSRIRTSVFNGTTQQDYIITGTSDNQRNKVAITFKENEFKTYLNGVLKNTDTIGVVPTGFDRVNFSNPDGTSRNFEGKVYDTRVYDRVLTEAEAIELTT